MSAKKHIFLLFVILAINHQVSTWKDVRVGYHKADFSDLNHFLMSCHNSYGYPFEQFALYHQNVRTLNKKQINSLVFKDPSILLENPQARWKFLKIQAEGSESTLVYKVKDILTKKIYALKILKRKKLDSTYRKDMLRMEIGSMMDIAYHAIEEPEKFECFCKMREIWEVLNGPVLILMDFCGGKDLGDRIWDTKDNRFPENTAKRIFIPLIKALINFKKIGYCHRDIKKSNVIMTPIKNKQGKENFDFKLYWIDLGFAWPIGVKSPYFPGTEDYKSPEIASKSKPFWCAPSDVWSLGVLIYRTITGEWPYGYGNSSKHNILLNKFVD